MAGKPQPDGEAHRAELLRFVQTFHRTKHYIPTIKDMADGTGLARTAIVWHLEKLRESNAVDYEDGNLARSLRLR